MASPEHEAVVSVLFQIFIIPNGASDVTIYPNVAHIPRPTIQHPGPPPSDARLWTRQTPAPPGSTPVAGLTGVSVQEWDFGTLQFNSNNPTGCTGPNIPAYQVNIPVLDVFWDPPIVAGTPNAIGYTIIVPPAITANNFVIDLYDIQQEILAT
ncbi:15999_t:CDS:2, partial [Racocetra fulgida]